MENLSEFYIQKAKTELGETETRKEQSIKQFYDWLSKHSFVKKCEMEPFQIVHHLRARKYNMAKSYESFNKFLVLKQNLPDLFNHRKSLELLEIYDKGSFLVPKKRNADGRQILIFRLKILEDLNVNFVDILKLTNLVGASLIHAPETQICGLIPVFDFRGISINFLKIIDMNVLSKLLILTDSMPGRFKQIVILGLPAVAISLFELAMSVMSSKMKERIKLCKNIKDFAKVVDVSNLTVEYGGSEDLEDAVKQHRPKVEEQIPIMIKFFESIEIDEAKMKIYENEKNGEGVGSFRTLEID